MKNFIDLMGNVTYSPKQIEKRMQAMTNAQWPKQRRERALRTGEQEALDAFFVDLGGLKEQIVADNQLLYQTIQYEKALTRLEQVILSEGRAAYTYEEATGAYTVDEETGEQVETMRTVEVPAIEPVPLTIMENVYDEETGELVGEQEVNNPLVVLDVTEREMAQSVVDGADDAVKQLAEERNK